MLKLLGWVGRAKADLEAFPPDVIREVGHALYLAQLGGKHVHAKPLKGFGGAAVLEVVEDHDGDTYRAVYTVRFAELVYVLHAFQKKAKHGIATPPQELEKIKSRLKRAEEEYEIWKRQNP
jgi:phage-related protein